MKIRDRYIATVLFENPDKIPFFPGRARKSTMEMWYKQGLPEGEDWFSYICNKLGIETEWIYSETTPDVNFRMIPEFEEKVLEKKERTQIVQDWKGNICEILNEYDCSYLRDPIDFVTRKWIKCPVENWDDWEDMKHRYDPNDPVRFPKDFADRCKKMDQQDKVVSIYFNGPFDQLREWLGFEGLCYSFIDKPDLIEDMVEHYKEFISILLEKVLRNVKIDYVHIAEDMAYKAKSIISPEMTRKFLFSTWKEWGEIARSYDCPIYDMDSDGYIGELIPIWIEAGFNINDPVEIAAGNDLREYQNKFGKKMAYLGGVDKRVIAKGGRWIKNELDCIKPCVEFGGYIPSCDHGIPSDVSWPYMIEYCKWLAKLTGWL